MSNTNTNLQTQTSNAFHNAIIEAGGKDRLPMLAPEGCMGNYKSVSQDIRNQLDVKAEAVQIILTGIYNDIYSTVDACPNACKMWKAIERLKHGKSINVQDLETNLYWEFGKFTSRDGESLESYHLRGTGYNNQRVINVVGARENVGTQVVQQSGIRCYNCKEYGQVARECQKPKRAKDAAYHKEKMLLCKQEEAEFQLNAEQIQEVTPDSAENSGPIFDTKPLQKIQNNDDNYNVFANDREHPEHPEFVNDTYLEEQGDTNITIDYMSTNEETVDHDDDNLARERDLLASLIDKIKCEIDDIENHNKLLESSNKSLVNKLKDEIEDFITKNKSLESSNNHFKEANNKLSKTNQLMFKDLKKFQAELDRYHDANYASKVGIDCAKAKRDLMSTKWNLKSHLMNILER
uniref:CCHC-type domain-containing protein n=1 Tax=Tanacetum cinerariifolium TaxID=118510 RepID=A0A699HJ79_TANCI|nr:hypothetical protein [Tanacetum cinerariifolium]